MYRCCYCCSAMYLRTYIMLVLLVYGQMFVCVKERDVKQPIEFICLLCRKERRKTFILCVKIIYILERINGQYTYEWELWCEIKLEETWKHAKSDRSKAKQCKAKRKKKLKNKIRKTRSGEYQEFIRCDIIITYCIMYIFANW